MGDKEIVKKPLLNYRVSRLQKNQFPTLKLSNPLKHCVYTGHSLRLCEITLAILPVKKNINGQCKYLQKNFF